MSSMTRRNFVKASAAAGLMAAAPFSRVRGANDDVRVAVVGIRNQGANHVNWFRKIPGVRVVAVCDVDSEFTDRERKNFAGRNEKLDTYRDCRKLLEDKSIDAIIIATCNHWHALVMIWGCQAGKDVYVEKPVCHNIREGRLMVEAARKYGRIVQAGTQRRSDTGLQEALRYIKAGNLGKTKLARGIIYVRRGSIGKVDGPQQPPATVDYNLWTGPAPLVPLMRKNLHYDWHWVWPTGNGDLGNNGIHFIDVCRWAIDQNKLAPRVLCTGGRFGYIDDGETANTQLIYLDYKPVPILFELRGLPEKKGSSAMDQYLGTRAGTVVHCEGGYFVGGWAYDSNGRKVKQFKRTGGAGHHENFIKAVRSRKVSDLNADILEGHLSSSLCHMGNISYRLGKQANPGDIADSIKGNADMLEAFERMQEHLRLNEVDFAETPRILGPWLDFDPKAERFTGDFSDKANELVSRHYRKPFVVPEKV